MARTVRSLLPILLLMLCQAGLQAQTVTQASARAGAPPGGRGSPAWTLKMNQEIRWLQVAVACFLLV